MSFSLWASSYISQSVPVIDHPLLFEHKSNFVTKEEAPIDDDFADPLGALDSLVDQQVDTTSKNNNESTVGPLSNTLVENPANEQDNYEPEFVGFRPWKQYRLDIQSHFHSKDPLNLETSFLKTTTVKHKNVSKKRPNDEPSSIGVLHDLSEEEYHRRFKDLTRVLQQLWQEERRIDCIKMCREVAALLSSPQIPRFYPQKFVLTTDLLEMFGRLVFERLKLKANEERLANGLDPLPSHFSTIDILEKTRITARNWFGKISEIREVIQRIYVEACLLPCMIFMDDSALNDNIMRLCGLACSIQHPLTSSYARCYIARISMRLMPLNRAPHWKCLHDWIQNFQQQPIVLLWPALEYIIQCVSYNAVSYEDLLPLWEYCKVPEKRPYMLKSMFNALPPLYLAEHSLNACKLLTSSEHITCEEICAFGESLLKTTVFEQNRRYILKSVWKCIKFMTSLKSFLVCCEVWIEFAARYFSISHVHFMLQTVIERLTPDRKFEQNAEILVSMIRRVVRSIRNVAELLDAEVFPTFFQLFTNKESAKQMSMTILKGIVSKHGLSSLKDMSLAYQLIDLCKCVHEPITIHSSDDEVLEAIELICRTIDRLDLKTVPEQGLSYFVALRAATLNLDDCQKYVIVRILELGLYVVRSARFSSARSAFVQACVANAFITVPSLPNPSIRIRMFIQSGKLALAAMGFLQVGSFVDTCLSEFHNFPQNEHREFVSLLSEFLAFLLTVPTFEDKNNLSSFETLFESIKRYEWQCLSSAEHADSLFACLRYLYTLKNSNSQFLWKVNSSQLFEVDPMLSIVFEQLSKAIQEESDKRPLISIGFLENLDSFAGNIDEMARGTAKIAYKKCKNANQSIVDRMSMLKFENNS